MPNRRKTVRRSSGLFKAITPARNRRVRPPTVSRLRSVSPAQVKQAAGQAGRAALRAAAVGGVLAAATSGGYLAYGHLMRSPTFRVTQIQVEGNRRLAAEDLRRHLQGYLGWHILSVDTEQVQRLAQAHPWVRAATVRRELPQGLRVSLQEQEARALLLLDHLYLVNPEGEVFKQASLEETAGLPVISGLSREGFLRQPTEARVRIRRALQALTLYRLRERPALSEVRVSPRGEVTLYLARGGMALRLGRQVNEKNLGRFDAVWASLGPEARRARVFYLGSQASADRVSVRMGVN